MSYTRDNGSTNPTLAGFCSFGGLQINDGTFKSANLGMLTGSPPVADVTSDLASDDGGIDGLPLYGSWKFTLECWLLVDSPDYVQAAINDLRSVFNLRTGLSELTFKARGDANLWQMLARVDGPIVVNDPGMGRRKSPRRDVTIPMFALDPRAYNADTLHAVTVPIGIPTTLTNSGDYPTPFTATFVGKLTNPSLDGPGAAGFNRLRLGNADLTNYVIASGHSDIVQTNPATTTGVTALDNTGADVYAKVANRSAGLIGPGGETWTLSTADGTDTGHVLVEFRDARI